MSLSNQATINLAVNVQNMAGLRSLTTGLMALKTQIIAIQRSPTMRSASGAVGTPVQQARQAAALQAAHIKGLAQIKGAQAQLTTQAGRLAAAQARLAQMSNRAATAMRQQRNEAKSLTDRIKTAEENVDALWRAAFRLQMLGADFSRMGRGIIDAVSGVTEVFGSFEFMANRAAGALGGFEAANVNAQVTTVDLQNAIMDTSQELRLFPADEVAKAVYYWGSTTGQVVETQEDLYNIMDSLVPVMQAAALTETSYETAIKGTYSILSQYYGAVVETAAATGDYNEMTRLAEEVTVRMFYATQKTALEFEDLVQSFKMVGPVASGVGATFEDMIGLLGRLGDLGIRGSMAGRSFRQMFMRMVSPPGPARQAIDVLWKELGDSTSRLFNPEFQGKSYMEMMFPKGEFVGTTDFMRNMTMAVKDLTTAERIAFLTKFSTANLLPTMIALIGQETRALENQTDVHSKLGASIEDQRALFQASWALLSNSWQGVVGEMQRAVENLQITMGRSFAEAFRPFISQATEAIQKVREWVSANPALIEQIGRLAGMAGGALLVVGALFTALGTAIGVVAGLRLAFEAFGGVFVRWTGFGILIAAVVDGIIRNFEEIQARLDVVVGAIQRAIQNVSGYFDQGGDVAGKMQDAFADVADTIISVFLGVVETLAYLIEEISKWRVVFEFIRDTILPVAIQFIAIWTTAKFFRAIAGIKLFGLSMMGAAVGVKKFLVNEKMIGPQMSRTSKAAQGLKSHLDLVAIAIGAVALAAYQNNWFSFRSTIDALTNSFRNLGKELDAAFDSIIIKNGIVTAMNVAGAEGAVTFSSSFRDALSREDFVKRGLLEGALGEVFTGEGVVGQALGPLFTTIMNTAINDMRAGFTDLWTSATFGAKNAEEAVANVNKKLQDAGLSVMEFWNAWEYGSSVMELSASDAGLFGEAVTRAMRDGVATIHEVDLELRKLGGLSAWEAPSGVINQLHGLSDAALAALNIVTRAQEEIQTRSATMARDLIAELQTLPATGLTEDQFIQKATILDKLQVMWRDLTPEYQRIVSEATENAVGSGTFEGMDAALLQGGTIESHLAQALADMGKRHIDAGTWQGVLDHVTNSFNAATANGMPEGNSLDWGAWIKTAFSELGVESVTETLYPKINAMADAAVGGFATIFHPDKLKDRLKDAIGDKKGWNNFFDALNAPLLKRALSGELGIESDLIATGYLQEMFEGFDPAWAALAPAEQQAMSRRILSVFNEDTLRTMEPEMQGFGVRVLASMYEGMGHTIPGWLLTFATQQGITFADHVERGALQNEITLNAPTIPLPVWAGSGSGRAPGEATGQAGGLMGGLSGFVTSMEQTVANASFAPPAIPVPETQASENAVRGYVSDITGRLTALNVNAQTWGRHLGERYAQGIREGGGAVTRAANNLAERAGEPLRFSQPPPGPLNKIREWGRHLVDNYALAMESNSPRVRRAAERIANNIADSLRELSKGHDRVVRTVRRRNRDLTKDLDDTAKRIITSVKGAQNFKNYDDYLAYLGKVHNRIQRTRDKVRRDRDDTVRDLTISKNDRDSRVTYESRHKKVIEIRLIASSPDGTVDRVELKALRRGIMDGLALADLEHIVNVT